MSPPVKRSLEDGHADELWYDSLDNGWDIRWSARTGDWVWRLAEAAQRTEDPADGHYTAEEALDLMGEFERNEGQLWAGLQDDESKPVHFEILPPSLNIGAGTAFARRAA